MLFAAACSAVAPSLFAYSPDAATPYTYLVKAPLNATVTPTPFQPIPPTAAAFSSQALAAIDNTEPLAITWANYPGPSIFPPIEIPPPMGILPQPEGQLDILLMGSDERAGEGGFRTDTLLLVTLNPNASTVNVTSFPRDLFVYLPGYTMERVNTAHLFGGWPMVADTFEYNFGVRPDYFVLVNFNAFLTMINTLGGIDVQSASAFTDQREGYGNFTIPAGTVHMDGETALWYVRARYSTNDFDRGRRQQEVLLGIFYRLMSQNAVANAEQLYNQYSSIVLTDMPFSAILPLLPLATKISTGAGQIQRFAIDPSQVSPWVNPFNGAQVLLPIREAVFNTMRQALNIP